MMKLNTIQMTGNAKPDPAASLHEAANEIMPEYNGGDSTCRADEGCRAMHPLLGDTDNNDTVVQAGAKSAAMFSELSVEVALRVLIFVFMCLPTIVCYPLSPAVGVNGVAKSFLQFRAGYDSAAVPVDIRFEEATKNAISFMELLYSQGIIGVGVDDPVTVHTNLMLPQGGSVSNLVAPSFTFRDLIRSIYFPGTKFEKFPAGIDGSVKLKEAVNKYCDGDIHQKHAIVKKHGPISFWDVSAVTDMFELFKDKTTFNEPLFWNTSQVFSMRSMFKGAVAFDQQLKFDVSLVKSMSGMFNGATKFNNGGTTLSFGSSNTLFHTSSMFQDATSFNQSVFLNTEHVETMRDMFKGATSFNKSINFDTHNVTDMRGMFHGATAFNNDDQLLQLDFTNLNRAHHVIDSLNFQLHANTLLSRSNVSFIGRREFADGDCMEIFHSIFGRPIGVDE